MNNWKKLTLKKRRIEEDEQHRKVGDWKKTELFETNIGTEKQSSVGTKKTNNYPESIKRSTILGPSADHRAKNTSDEIEGQGGRILKLMALASLRKTGGYRSLFAGRVKVADQTNGYRRLPKPCHQCNLLQLGPVISIEKYGNEKSGRSFSNGICTADQKLHKEKRRKLTPSMMKESQDHLSSQIKNNSPMKLSTDARHQYRLKNMNRKEKNESYSSFCGLSLRENEKTLEKTENRRQMVKANDIHEDAGISDVDFDSEMSNMLLDIPENGLVDESCLNNKHKGTVRENFAYKEKEAAIEVLESVPSKINVKSKLFSSFSNEYDTAEKDIRVAEKRSKNSVGVIDKTVNKKMGKSNPIMGNNAKECNMPKVSRKKAISNGKRNNPTTLKIPHPTVPCSYDFGRDKDCDDDDVIITKEIYKRQETIYGENRTSKHRKVADSMNVNRKLNALEGSHSILNGAEKFSKVKEKKPQFSNTVKSASYVKKTNDKCLPLDNGDCPMCLMKFPQGWKSDQKDQHISECLADDMFADENEDF